MSDTSNESGYPQTYAKCITVDRKANQRVVDDIREAVNDFRTIDIPAMNKIAKFDEGDYRTWVTDPIRKRAVYHFMEQIGELVNRLHYKRDMDLAEKDALLVKKYLETILTNPSLLRIDDHQLPTKIQHDSAGFAVSVVLLQGRGGRWHPVCCTSCKVNSADRNYPVHEQELLGLVHCLKDWRLRHQYGPSIIEASTDSTYKRQGARTDRHDLDHCCIVDKGINRNGEQDQSSVSEAEVELARL
ncbi:hypothetical protein SeLEV6574_g01422 [Synchytrium endobioticum]|uniref:Reverse transcriptase/retrotransposon-derived protein RNase H-like domain-containing protein n=1 Tax=Synchytrium endobioticum TaxID=286115 RepID=A0A507DF97_9FUNG|nr:hypothetical protein SeLEV6574_g01422 [Synchytrium endobioticum]